MLVFLREKNIRRIICFGLLIVAMCLIATVVANNSAIANEKHEEEVVRMLRNEVTTAVFPKEEPEDKARVIQTIIDQMGDGKISAFASGMLEDKVLAFLDEKVENESPVSVGVVDDPVEAEEVSKLAPRVFRKAEEECLHSLSVVEVNSNVGELTPAELLLIIKEARHNHDVEWLIENEKWAELLECIKDDIYKYYTHEEVRQTTLIVMAEDLVAYSDTVWSAHVWVIVTRVGNSGFLNNDSIIGILSAPSQFSTYNTENLAKEPDPRVEAIVLDVFARKKLEEMGAPEWAVGRTMPKTHLFFDDRDENHFRNEFYRYCWGDTYDPFDSPHNPYDN